MRWFRTPSHMSSTTCHDGNGGAWEIRNHNTGNGQGQDEAQWRELGYGEGLGRFGTSIR